MFKKFLFLILLVTIVSGDLLDEKIQNLLGSKEYQRHSKLVNLLFKDKDFFYNGDKLKLIRILTVLKKNGLLHLKYNEPKELVVKFHIDTDPIKSLKILNDTLKLLGYYYYFTKEARYEDDGSLVWTIRLKTEYAIDPLILANELKKQEVFIDNIYKNSKVSWIYKLRTKNSKISTAVKIDTNEKIVFKKPLNDYFIKINEADTLQVQSRKLNHWFPYIVFYDNHLNILKVIKKKRVYKGIKTKIPKGTHYIKIGDLYNLINIKRGLSVIVQKKEN